MRVKDEFRQETVIKKSQFIAALKQTRTEEEARAYIAEIRREFSDATHVCTAYVIGPRQEIQRSSDNGEPAGTAGVPILEALKKSGLQDVTCCVIRYFGGIKLGAGGLIRAYGGAAADACAAAPKTEDKEVDVYEISYPYEMQGTLETWLRRNAVIRDVLYDEHITVLIETEKKDLAQNVRDLSHGTVQPRFLRTRMTETDL